MPVCRAGPGDACGSCRLSRTGSCRTSSRRRCGSTSTRGPDADGRRDTGPLTEGLHAHRDPSPGALLVRLRPQATTGDEGPRARAAAPAGCDRPEPPATHRHGSRRTRAAGGGASARRSRRAAGDLGRNPSRDVSPDDAPCAGRQGSGPWGPSRQPPCNQCAEGRARPALLSVGGRELYPLAVRPAGQVRLVLGIPEVDSVLDPSSRATCSARAVAPISVNSRCASRSSRCRPTSSPTTRASSARSTLTSGA